MQATRFILKTWQKLSNNKKKAMTLTDQLDYKENIWRTGES